MEPSSWAGWRSNLSAAQLLDPGTIDHLLHGCRDRGTIPAGWSWRSPETSVLPRVDAAQGRAEADPRGRSRHPHGRLRHRLRPSPLLRDLPRHWSPVLDRSFVTHLGPHGGTSAASRRVSQRWRQVWGWTPSREGIETESQAQLVESLGWEHGQGYLFGRPDPARRLVHGA